MSGVRVAIGLMSGTSMDGVDVAAIETDGRRVAGFGPTLFRPYGDGERATIRRAVVVAAPATDRAARPDDLRRAEEIVTAAHADAVKTFLSDNGLTAADVAVVGFHGQTVLHAPERHLTIQLGDGLALARASGIPVVYDFRAADVAAGGEGAPFVPIYHAALAASLAVDRPIAVLNVGGVANLTWIGTAAGAEPTAEDLVAFDCGPGNGSIDDWCLARAGRAMDFEGRFAAAGRVDEAIVARLLADPFFHLPAPKSLDRKAFGSDAVAGLSLEDGAATLTAFTAAAIARGLDLLPTRPASLIVAGGGAHNPTLLAMIRARTDAAVTTADAVGWSTDFLEAQAFAHLAVRHLEGLPLSFPRTTGVPHPMRGGVSARW
ncbi:anhydro-N-acetylmuramic acid kinase [Siculibacillus lacustris]|uniref:Anhydro-N-acetylmuramic acid kinase n=1 Tax=Siculibacillus lacustris TaxID=1549641 RepID=A0A4Q9VRE4_9HYPH|nr:anhydro-N-acetylmuramic acid kinase [Siculibacillus lacustris]TBW38454.1 anhydro-N-acetylmuramic acid kinase [Siculibacillus lacustris]